MSLEDTWRFDPVVANNVVACLTDLQQRLAVTGQDVATGSQHLDAWQGNARRAWNNDLARHLGIAADVVDDLRRAITRIDGTHDAWRDHHDRQTGERRSS